MSRWLDFSPEEVELIFPISHVTVYNGGLMITRKCNLKSLSLIKKAERKEIMRLSRRSLSRLAFLASTTDTVFISLITLTYGPNFPRDGKKVKSHLNHFLTAMRQRYKKFSYLWFLEFQPNRQAPHFHILTTLPAPGPREREKFALLWTNIVEPHNWPYTSLRASKGRFYPKQTLDCHQAVLGVHRHYKAWERIRDKDGAKRYVVKYATKLEQKEVPQDYRDVGRFWGASYDVRPGHSVTYPADDEMVRQIGRICGRDLSKLSVLPKFIMIL